MEELANKVQIIINTLESLEIVSKYDTITKLAGCMQELAKIRDELKNPIQLDLEVEDGNNHAG